MAINSPKQNKLYTKKRKWVHMKIRKRTKGKKGVDVKRIVAETWQDAHRKFGK